MWNRGRGIERECVCVCVERERERERENGHIFGLIYGKEHTFYAYSFQHL
jgi:hypothetical protein